jgi:hypothetical protein
MKRYEKIGKVTGGAKNLHGEVQRSGQQGKLNPNWVEQLMGLSTGWTALDYSEME